MLLGLKIRNFAVLKDFSMGISEEDIFSRKAFSRPRLSCFPISKVSAIIGKNNSGKSVLFEALSFFADCLRYNPAYASNLFARGGFSGLLTDGGKDSMSADFLILSEKRDKIFCYSTEFSSDQMGRPYVSSEKIKRLKLCKDASGSGPSKFDVLMDIKNGEGSICSENGENPVRMEDIKASAISSFARQHEYAEIREVYKFISRIFYLRNSDGVKQAAKTPFAEGGHRHINSYGTNALNVLSYLKQTDINSYSEILGRISAKIPGLKKMNFSKLSSGAKSGEGRLFILMLLLMDPAPRPLILLENPDMNLYPDMLEKLSSEIRAYGLRNGECQLIYSTHSQMLLESMHPEEVWTLYREGEDERDGSEENKNFFDPLIEVAGFSQNKLGDKGAKSFCVAESEIVRAMYEEGVGLGSLWYSGYFSRAGEKDEG